MNSKEFILSNNDYVAVVDSKGAEELVKKVQQGILERLRNYDTDFIEQTESALLNGGGFFSHHLLSFVKNRSESLYIAKSREINAKQDKPLPSALTSLEARRYIKQVMSDASQFLIFNQKEGEEKQDTLQRMRKELANQLNLIKYLFFRKEYNSIKKILNENDDKVLLDYLMKNERDLYLKAIVVCTTGPIQISKSLFKGYVVSSDVFKKKIQRHSFRNYDLHEGFKSQNSLALHENMFGMLRFLGMEEGRVNDSSWLDSGKEKQETRSGGLQNQKEQIAQSLPQKLSESKKNIKKHVRGIGDNWYGCFFKARNKAKKESLQKILMCFHKEGVNEEFNVEAFKEVQLNEKIIFAALYFSQTQKLIQELDSLCYKAIIFNLTKNKKITVQNNKARGTETPNAYSL